MNRAKHNSFQTWWKNLHIKKSKNYMDTIREEMSIQKHETETIVKIRTYREIQLDYQTKKLDIIKTEQIYHNKKIKNVIELISKTENDNFKINRRQHVFNLWKNYCYDKRKLCCRLEVLMKRNARQIAFDAIRDKARGLTVNQHKDKKL
jgi:hypothetical protein